MESTPLPQAAGTEKKSSPSPLENQSFDPQTSGCGVTRSLISHVCFEISLSSAIPFRYMSPDSITLRVLELVFPVPTAPPANPYKSTLKALIQYDMSGKKAELPKSHSDGSEIQDGDNGSVRAEEPVDDLDHEQVKVSTPQRQDAFGDESNAQVKYKVLSWW